MRVLIIGDVQSMASNFEKQGALVRLFKNADTFRKVVAETMNLITDVPVVVGDLSLIRGSGRLAKYLEEAMPEKLICLASRDRFDSVVLARITKKIKKSKLPEFTGKFNSVKAREALMDNPIRWDKLLEHNPLLLPIAMEASRSKNRRRVVGML